VSKRRKLFNNTTKQNIKSENNENAFAGSRTRVYCLEGNYPNRWTKNAFEMKAQFKHENKAISSWFDASLHVFVYKVVFLNKWV
jgi:hypothetical protein